MGMYKNMICDLSEIVYNGVINDFCKKANADDIYELAISDDIDDIESNDFIIEVIYKCLHTKTIDKIQEVAKDIWTDFDDIINNLLENDACLKNDMIDYIEEVLERYTDF